MKIGDYVRTKYGTRPIVDLRKNGKDQIIMVIIRDNQLNQIGLEMEYIKKHSPNLIDLIECGDYVNGSRVVNIYQKDSVVIEKHENIFEEDGTVWSDCIEVNVNDIKEILTKEQYEREVFRV